MADVKPSVRRKSAVLGPQNQLGQVMGAKGAKTRRRLLDATEELLKTTSLRDLRVTQIVRAAKTSAATFYVYFNDVSEAVLALIGELTQSPPSIMSLVTDPWEESQGYERCQAFVAAYVDNWRANASLFRVRNMASDEGDQRFSQVRINSIAPLIQALSARIEAHRAAGRLPADLHPTAAAGALLAMIERLAVVPLVAVRAGVTRRTLMESAAFFATLLMGGRVSEAPSARMPLPVEVNDVRADAAAGQAVRSSLAAGRINQQGQAMGEKGARTRRRLLEATDHLLRTRPLLELSVADIAKGAETSPATFYLYFPDVSEAVLAVISEISQSTPHLLALATAAGEGPDGDLKAQEFVHAYIAHWRNHGPLFRVRNLAADEGDERFLKVRNEAIRPLLEMLTQKVEKGQVPGGATAHLHPRSAVAGLLSMIDRMAVTPNIIPNSEVNLLTVGRAAGYYLAVLVSGQIAPEFLSSK